MIVIIDYGMGNVGSILNMLKRIRVEAKISSDKKDIESAEKLILPGVGAFDTGMRNITKFHLRDILDQRVLVDKIPVLGVCLGMQLLTKKSEEGQLPGLGWLDGQTVKFRFPDQKLRIPHMGWNTIKQVKKSGLVVGLAKDTRFYFVHSYFIQCNEPTDIVATTPYGDNFASIVEHGNIYGVQFHPEKSHKFGMKLYQNFSAM